MLGAQEMGFIWSAQNHSQEIWGHRDAMSNGIMKNSSKVILPSLPL